MMPSASVMLVIMPAPRGKGRGHDAIAHLTQLDPQELFDAQAGGDFAGGHHGHGLARVVGHAQHVLDQGLNKLLTER